MSETDLATRDDLSNEEVADQLEHLLQELRVALPGVQILFAFLLTIPFANRFATVTEFQKDVYFAALSCTLVSSAFLMAPTAYHRIRFRRHGDPDRMLRTSNTLSLIGLGFLSLALPAAILLVADFVFSLLAAAILTTATGLLIGIVWYALPLRRFLQD